MKDIEKEINDFHDKIKDLFPKEEKNETIKKNKKNDKTQSVIKKNKK